jgi:hypothetical protein
MPDDSRAGCRTTSISGRANDAPGNVFARTPSRPWRLEQKRLAAIDGERVDRNNRFIGSWLGFGDIRQANHRL